MRNWRKSHPLTASQRKRDNARSFVSTYLKRGKIKKLACEVCGCSESQAHHEDYNKPLEVIWLCKACHKAIHKAFVPVY
jgi:hypothetical protein